LLVNEKQKALAGYEKLKDTEKLTIKIEKHREKRSKDANALYWKMINEISNELIDMSKDELHFSMLKKYGQRMLVPIIKGENPRGYFTYFEYYDSKIINGKEADYYLVYKNSSEMNSKEFWLLLQGVLGEARELGIETPDDWEANELIKEMERREIK
jgi:hypothetical protein